MDMIVLFDITNLAQADNLCAYLNSTPNMAFLQTIAVPLSTFIDLDGNKQHTSVEIKGLLNISERIDLNSIDLTVLGNYNLLTPEDFSNQYPFWTSLMEYTI